MTNLASAFQRYVRSRAASEFQRRVAELAAHGSLTRPALVEAARDAGLPDIAAATDDLLDLLLYYVRLSLSDHELSDGEMGNVRTVARLFEIEEGDLLQRRGDEVAELVSAEMRRILTDQHVDASEAKQKVRIQEALGLSYDQFVELSKPLVEEAVVELFEAGGADVEWLQRRVGALDTVYRLDEFVDRRAADLLKTREGRRVAEGEAGMPDRGITQEVKDMVWRRDQGRCTECGESGGLEFEPIIPVSRGGSSAYRNVELLCETCRDRKAGAQPTSSRSGRAGPASTGPRPGE